MSPWLPVLLVFSLISPAFQFNLKKSPSRNAVLLSNVKTLTLYADRETSHRRVQPIPQLRCVGPSKKICNLYKIDVMQCTNQGSDYDDEDIQWVCTAQLPPEFKLGSTDVVCEGYRNADDPWVLKGSCGVEYMLMLTDRGEERYGKIAYSGMSGWLETIWDALFGLVFFGVVAVIVLAMLGCFNGRNTGQRRNRGWGWGGGGGGGGDDGGWGPPPPYDYQQPGYTKYDTWRPGFWSGALGGAAAGYAMGRGRDRGRQFGGSSQAGPSRPSFPSSSTTSESTGFGSTRRR